MLCVLCLIVLWGFSLVTSYSGVILACMIDLCFSFAAVAAAVGLFRGALCLAWCNTVLPELSPCCCPGSLHGSIPPCVLYEILGTCHKLGSASLRYVVLPG